VNPALTAVRLGLERGRIELRQTFTSVSEIIQIAVFTLISLTVLVVFRHRPIPDSHSSLSLSILPSLIGMNIAFTGLAGISGQMPLDRDDGTLLRAKAIPGGVTGYLIGRTTTQTARMLIGIIVVLAAGTLLVKGVTLNSASAWLTLAWVIPLGLVATLPIGLALGAFINSKALPLLLLATIGLAAISGIFYPITHLPAVLQVIGQISPVYWLGLGMRSGLLPHSLAALEIGRSWRHWQTFAVLSAWAIFGLSTAPVMVRRMARRQAGSRLTARREKLMRTAG
jgi:ABC-2 type transport system permease protein